MRLAPHIRAEWASQVASVSDGRLSGLHQLSGSGEKAVPGGGQFDRASTADKQLLVQQLLQASDPV